VFIIGTEDLHLASGPTTAYYLLIAQVIVNILFWKKWNILRKKYTST